MGADDVPVTQRDDGEEGTAATHREGIGVRKSRTEPSEAFSRGTLIGRYVLIDLVGAGGMGVVYAALDPELDRKVAIKVLQARPGGSESGGQTWLLREAQALARLAHPNVVAIHDVGAMAGEMVFIAMELVEGGTLRAWLKGTRRSWREVLTVMRAAGAGLAAAHAAGLVHRDFKPDNVLVGSDGRVRVMDFGLARLDGTDDAGAAHAADLKIEARSSLSARLTEAGALLGTPAYMAPEIYSGQIADALADQFAFGVALYEALYRKRPFDRDELVEKRAVAPEPPASARVPAWLERIVLRAIAIDPAQRFPSMEALLAELARDPTRTRRTIALGAAALVVAGGAITLGVLMGREHTVVAAAPPLCMDAAAKLTNVWDATTRASVAAAFAKVGKASATDALRGVETILDGYATAWVAMRTEACQATRVHGSQSEEVMTLRMSCLDDRRVELETLVGIYASADEQLVQAAIAPATKLSKLADCANVPALLAPDPLPRDPAARALRERLARARITYKSARLADTLALLAEMAPAAAAVGHLPTQAELHLLTGQALWVTQGAAKGEPEMLEAVSAAEQGKADGIKAEAWLQLTNLATSENHYDVATERLAHTKAALARAGGNRELEVRVLAADALLHGQQAQFDKALEVIKHAREIAEAHTEGPSIAYASLVEASLQTMAGRPQDAIGSFGKVLAQQNALGHHRIDVATTLQSMAAAELAIGKLDDAVVHLRDALEITEDIFGKDSPDAARPLTALAAVQLAKGDLEGSLQTNLRALHIVETSLGKQDKQYAFMLGQVAESLVNLQRPAEALPYVEEALPIQIAKQGAGSVDALTLMLTKCDAQQAIGKAKAAVETCQRAFVLGEKQFGKASPILFIFLSKLGVALTTAHQPRAAIAYLDRALQLGTANPTDIALVQMQNARARWNAKDKRRAVELARTAQATYVAAGPEMAPQAAEIAAWLGARPSLTAD